MLLTKEVEVYLTNNISYFENLGYEIPRRDNGYGKMTIPNGTKIKVKTTDLKPSSKNRVVAKCECCKRDKDVSYNSYANSVDKHGEYYCPKCVMKLFNSGENNYKWNPNKTDEERLIGRKYPEYNEFVRKVLARDKYTCRCCGQIGDKLEVHHLDGYDWCVERRTDETNGVCVCKTCHKAFHAIHGSGGNTKEQFEYWLGKALIELKEYNGVLPTTNKVILLNTMKIYDSVKEVEKELGIESKAVAKVCSHNRYSINDLHFMYLKEYEYYIDNGLDLKDAHTYQGISQYGCGLTKEVICLTTNTFYNSILEASMAYNISYNNRTNICFACSRKVLSAGTLPDGTPLRWMYADDFRALSKKDQEKALNAEIKYRHHTRAVICVTTNKIFDSAPEAAKYYGLKDTGIQGCCAGRYKSSGKLEDGTPMVWMYYDVYLAQKEGKEITVTNPNNERSVICTTTGVIFQTIKDGKEYYKIKSNGTISRVCRGFMKSTGKLPDGTPLAWMYYEDFLKLPQEEQNEILARNKDSSNDGSF